MLQYISSTFLAPTVSLWQDIHLFGRISLSSMLRLALVLRWLAEWAIIGRRAGTFFKAGMGGLVSCQEDCSHNCWTGGTNPLLILLPIMHRLYLKPKLVWPQWREMCSYVIGLLEFGREVIVKIYAAHQISRCLDATCVLHVVFSRHLLPPTTSQFLRGGWVQRVCFVNHKLDWSLISPRLDYTIFWLV